MPDDERAKNFCIDKKMAELFVDAKSQELMTEFLNHYKAVAKEDPNLEGRRHDVFEGWAIQKIAGLHLVIDRLIKKIIVNETRDENGGDCPF
ncbi:MAG: hypothetical protein V1706_08570 [Pseudomonadota bacterium]